MKNKVADRHPVHRHTFKRAALAIAVATICSPAYAFQFSAGGMEGSLDTTLSWGVRSRTEDQDKRIIGVANGGSAFSVNGDTGNLNYDKGIISNAVKVTSELELSGERSGVFIRGSAFYDKENMDEDREHSPLTDKAEDRVGRDAEILDAYGWIQGGDEHPYEVRLGNQTISWGESTFIQNGINVINPIDVSKIRVPGAELREALTPVPLLYGSIALDENSSIEGFYQLEWDKTDIDPPGSYFSTNDFAGAGGTTVQLGFGAIGEGPFNGVGRAKDETPSDSGQFGLAYRFFAPQLNDTEFGFFFMNYHSRLPVLNGLTGTAEGLAAAQAIATGSGAAVAQATGAALQGGSAADAAITAGVNAGTARGMTEAQAKAVATATATGQDVTTAVTQAATDAYSRTARYKVVYPEDIQLFGLSFNTLHERSGVALQGEVSHRRDQPLQVDDVELLFATLGPANPAIAANNQLGNYAGQTETEIPGFILRDVTQLQVTATKLFGPITSLGADDFVLVGEVGATYIHDMPSKSELRLDGPGTYLSGNEALASAHGAHANGQFEDSSHFADSTSWGVRLVGKLTYTNAIGGVNLSPRLALSKDVKGITPAPIANFLEGRHAVTVGLGADYQNQWSGDLSVTRYGGAGRYNLINDRDFVAFNVKYSF